MIFFTTYVHSKSVKMLSLALSWINGKDWRTWRNIKYLMFDDYILVKVLGKIKEIIGIEKFDES